MILTKHSLTVEANCPVDDEALDVYEVTVETHQMITVESILAAVKHLTTGKPLYQEDLTRRLSRTLQARVITVGEHSGVTTTCEALGW